MTKNTPKSYTVSYKFNHDYFNKLQAFYGLPWYKRLLRKRP